MSKLDGIKAGDRVRVTFEGVVTDSGRDVGVRLAAEHDIVWVGAKTNRSHDHFQITRIEPAFKVGDEVTYNSAAGRVNNEKGRVVAILSDGRIVFEYQAGDTSNVMARDPSCFTHA